MDRSTALVLAVLAISYVIAGHRYAQVWRSDLTLWTHAQSLAPLKMRPVLNLEKARASR